MNVEYTRDEMVNWLETKYRDKGYIVEHYSDKFLPARVPLHCEKKENGGIDEIVIEITNDERISKDDFFPLLIIKENYILDASPVRFYQYYFPNAKIYYAYPDYATKGDGLNDFKNVCKQRGIGLLKVSSENIEEEIIPISLLDKVCILIENKGEKHIKDIMKDHFHDFLTRSTDSAANADFLCPLRNIACEYAINADCGEKQRNSGKTAQ